MIEIKHINLNSIKPFLTKVAGTAAPVMKLWMALWIILPEECLVNEWIVSGKRNKNSLPITSINGI